MVRDTWVQSQIASYQRLKKWYLIPPCLTLSNIRYVSRVKWSNLGKGVAPSPTHWCSSYWKGSLLVTLDYDRQLYLLTQSYRIGIVFCTQSYLIQIILNKSIGPLLVLPLLVRVNLGVIAMRSNSTFPKSLEPEPHHEMQFSFIPRTPPGLTIYRSYRVWKSLNLFYHEIYLLIVLTVHDIVEKTEVRFRVIQTSLCYCESINISTMKRYCLIDGVPVYRTKYVFAFPVRK